MSEQAVIEARERVGIAGIRGDEVAGEAIEVIEVGGVGGINVVHEFGPALEPVFTGQCKLCVRE